MLTVLTQSPEPASAASSTSTPSCLYHPIFVATANGAAAEEITLEQKPTRNLDTLARPGAYDAATSKHTSSATTILFIASSFLAPVVPFRRGPRRERGGGLEEC